MKHHTRHAAGSKSVPKTVPQNTSAFISKPIDGRHYLEVIEEQEYAERRPTPEEQRPRFSYLKSVQAK